MSFVRRYEEDSSAPTAEQVRSDLGHRGLLPALYLWMANLVVGLTIVGPLESFPAETEVNRELVERRSPLLDDLTQVWSNIGGTHFLVAACLVVVAALWWRTRQWWFALVPAIALSVQSAVFTTSSFLVGRLRPDVEHLDISPPTSGFPSGHTGAATAFYLVVALLAQRIRRPFWRWAVTALCVLVPLLVGFSRLYRGMHFLSDITVGFLNGVVCAWLAWRYLRRGPRERPGGGDGAVLGDEPAPDGGPHVPSAHSGDAARPHDPPTAHPVRRGRSGG